MPVRLQRQRRVPAIRQVCPWQSNSRPLLPAERSHVCPAPPPRCKCFPGHRGPDCGTVLCKGTPRECSGPSHGTCGLDGVCHCKPGWGGETCERATCPAGDAGVCSGRGKCQVMTTGASCNCTAPYSGPACNEAVCPNDCSGRGVCTQPPNLLAGRCVCDPGWTGETCSVLRLAPTPAAGGYGFTPNVSSWGGAQLLVGDTYHLYTAEMVHP